MGKGASFGVEALSFKKHLRRETSRFHSLCPLPFTCKCITAAGVFRELPLSPGKG